MEAAYCDPVRVIIWLKLSIVDRFPKTPWQYDNINTKITFLLSFAYQR